MNWGVVNADYASKDSNQVKNLSKEGPLICYLLAFQGHHLF